MASNKYSSTNIAELLESQIEAMKNINDMIVGAKIDEAMLKNIVNTVKPLSEVFSSLGKAAEAMASLKIPGPVATLKFKLGVKGLVTNIKYIAEELGKLEFDKETATKMKGISQSISEIASITGDLTSIGFASILLVAMKPLILKTIKLILEINQKLAEAGDGADPKAVAALGGVLADLGKGLLVFVITTMGGIVPMIAMVSLLAVKAFVWLFCKLFSGDTMQQIQVSMDGIGEMGKAIIMLSLTVLLMALVGVFVIEAWKQILITMVFVAITIGLFWLLGFAAKGVDAGKETLFAISGTLIILSMTVLLWALIGEFVMESWQAIIVTMLFVAAAIGLFALLALAGQLIKTGAKELLTVALTLVLLSLTVLLWAETGDFVLEKWASVLIMVGFTTVAIGLFALLALAGKIINEGGMTMLLIAGTLFILTLVVIMWAWAGEYVMNRWAQTLVMGLFVLVAIGLFALLGATMGIITEGGLTVLLLAGALFLLSGVVVLWAWAGGYVMEHWVEALIMMGFVVLVIAVVVALSFAAPYIAPGIAALVGISAGLLIFSVAMVIMGAAAKLYTWETVGLIMGIIGGLGVVFAGLGLALPLVLLGSIALGFVSAALVIFGPAFAAFMLGVKTMKDADVETGDVTKPVWLMRSLVSAINKAFGWRGAIALFRAAGKVWAMIPIALAVGTVARVLANIASLKMPTGFDKDGNPTGYEKMTPDDFALAAGNAAGMTSIMANLFGENPVTVEMGNQKITITPISSKALENLTWGTKRKMQNLATITQAIGRMADVLQKIASLNVPDADKGFDKEGKPLGYKQMRAEDFAMAAENASSIAIMLSSIFGEKDRFLFVGGKLVRIRCIDQDALDNITRSARNKMERLSEITTAVGNMASVLQNISSLNMPIDFDKKGKATGYKKMEQEDFENATQNVATIMTVLLSAVGNEEISATLEELDSDASENFATVLKGCEGLKFLMDAIKESVEIDDTTIATGVGNIRTALSAYLKILNDLFIGESEWVWKRGWLGIPYPSLNVIKPPEIDLDDLEDAQEGMDLVKKSMDATSGIMTMLKQMSEDAGKTNPDQISNIIKQYIASIFGDEQGKGGIQWTPMNAMKLTFLQNVIDQQERISNIKVDNLKRNTENFIKFVDKANSIDVDKIRTVRDMFEQIARFSESVNGNFDALADVLSDKLVEVLEKLHGTLEDIQNMPAPAQGGGIAAAVGAGAEAVAQNAATPGKTPTEQVKQNQQINTKEITKSIGDVITAIDKFRKLYDQRTPS